MEKSYTKIYTTGATVPLKIRPGHFATNHAHINYYIDVTTLKARTKEAEEVAQALVGMYLYDTVIDTIVCMEGTEVIGAFLVEELAKGGFLSTNAHKSIYVISPEFNNNSQIIITSDKLPREIPDLEERLVTRFEGGVLSNIQVPNVETRIAILQKKAEMENAVVDNRIIEYIVDNVAVNIRTLEGALQTVISTARISNQPITLELAERTIKNKVAHEKHLTQDIVITKVCEYYGLSRDKMMGTSRKKDVLLPRQVSMYFCRNLLSMSLPAIGKLFKKDHSTVSNAIDKIEEGMRQDPLLQSDIANIRRAIEA